LTSRYLHTSLPPPAPFEPTWVRDEVSHLDTALVPVLPLALDGLRRRFKGVPLLFRFPPRSFYGWHIDRLRRCALNYEVQPAGQVLFGVPGPKGSFTDLEVLDYQGRLVLLDTSRWHAVSNPTALPRVVFSLGFNEVSFKEVAASLNTGEEGT